MNNNLKILILDIQQLNNWEYNLASTMLLISNILTIKDKKP